MTRYNFKIGTTLLGMTNVEELTIPLQPPRYAFKDFQESVQTPSGISKGLGYPSATWYWGFLTNEQLLQLRTFCPGESATIFIQTFTNEVEEDGDDELLVFTGVVHWPVEQDRQAHKAIDFTLLFTNLVEIEPEE